MVIRLCPALHHSVFEKGLFFSMLCFVLINSILQSVFDTIFYFRREVSIGLSQNTKRNLVPPMLHKLINDLFRGVERESPHTFIGIEMVGTYGCRDILLGNLVKVLIKPSRHSKACNSSF